MYFTPPSTSQPIDVSKIEQSRSAKYLGDFCIKNTNGSWSEIPVAVFYQATKPDPSYSHYFGIFIQDGQILITDAASAFENPIKAVIANDGEIVFSRYRHDYAVSVDGSVWIDGGRDYLRSGGTYPGNFVMLQMLHSEFVVIEPEEQNAAI